MAKKQEGEKKGKVGQSIFTTKKQRMFSSIVASHTRYFAKQSSDPYYHFDIYAGPGRARYGEGSPLLFFRHRKPGLTYRSYFVENNNKNAFALRLELEKINDPNIKLYNIRCESFLKLLVAGIHQHIRGLIYADPNGILPIEELKMFAEVEKAFNVDLLMKIDMKSYKRGDLPTGVTNRDYHMNSLKSIIGELNRKYWFVSIPVKEPDNYSMLLLATNCLYKPPRFFIPINDNAATFWISRTVNFYSHITDGVIKGLLQG